MRYENVIVVVNVDNERVDKLITFCGRRCGRIGLIEGVSRDQNCGRGLAEGRG